MATGTLQPLVLVVDDQASIRDLCAAVLAAEYRVALAESGEQGLREVFEHKPSLVLLDVGLSGIDGVETCRRIRDLSAIPIIMLTGRAEDHDVVRALDAGANDYVVKPFSPAQLLARIRAALRTHEQRGSGAAPTQEALTFDEGRLIVNPLRRTATVQGREVTLTATEYKLLELLALHPGNVLSPDLILDRVWGPAYSGSTDYVKAYVKLLRRKIEPDPRQPVYLRARRGLGYYLEPRPTAAPNAPTPTSARAA